MRQGYQGGGGSSEGQEDKAKNPKTGSFIVEVGFEGGGEEKSKTQK